MLENDLLCVADSAGLLERWPLAAQMTVPWTRLGHIRAGIDVAEGMTAAQIIAAVLEATVD